VPFWHLAEAAAVARAFPDTPIVLNHTGFPWDRSEEGLAAWRRGMEVLAREPNVMSRSPSSASRTGPGLPGEPPRCARCARDLRHRAGDLRNQLPVAGLRIGYGALVAAMSRMLGDFSPADRDRFFWQNAKPSTGYEADANRGCGSAGRRCRLGSCRPLNAL